MRKILLSFACVVAGVCSVYAQNTGAGSTEKDTTYALRELYVTDYNKSKQQVLKIDVPLKFIPVAVSSVQSTAIVNRDISDIQEAVKFLPGVRIQTSYGAFQQMQIRGFDHSVIMVDGVRDERSAIDNSYPFMDLSAVEKIELLKGPSSVLYGSSAVGGVINIVRKAPSAQQHLFAKISYGSWYTTNARMAFGGKLLGPVNYQASFNYQNQDGWRDNRIRRLSGYFALGGDFGRNDMVEVRFGGGNDFYATEIGLPALMTADIYDAATEKLYLNKNDMLPGLDRKWRYNSESDEMYNRNWNVSAKWVHRFNDNLKLTENISYTNDDIDYFSTEELDYLTSSKPIYPWYYEAKPGVRTYISLDSLYYGYPLRFSHMAKTVNNQIELSGKFRTGSVVHNFMGGNTFIYLDRVSYSGYLFGSRGDDVVGPGLTGHGTTYNPHSIGWMDTKFSKATPQFTRMLGFYFHDVMDLTSKWKFMVAGRYDTYSFKRASGIDVINGGRKYGHVDSDKYSKLKTGAFTFKTGVVYLPVEDLSLFASYGTYFKPIRTFYNDNTIYVDREGKIFTPEDGKEVFKPEKGGQFEIGARYEISSKLRADFSLFLINKYNMTRNIASKGDVIGGETLEKNVVGQVGKMRSQGFDVEVSYIPVTGMVLTAGYAYTDAKVKEMAKNKYMDSDATKGKQYARIPKNTFFVMGDYVVPSGVMKGLGVNFDVDFLDKVYRNATNTTWFDSYWLTNIGFSYNLKNGIRLGLNIKNLFNEKYFNQSLGNQMVPSQPRNYTLSVQYAF